MPWRNWPFPHPFLATARRRPPRSRPAAPPHPTRRRSPPSRCDTPPLIRRLRSDPSRPAALRARSAPTPRPSPRRAAAAASVQARTARPAGRARSRARPGCTPSSPNRRCRSPRSGGDGRRSQLRRSQQSGHHSRLLRPVRFHHYHYHYHYHWLRLGPASRCTRRAGPRGAARPAQRAKLAGSGTHGARPGPTTAEKQRPSSRVPKRETNDHSFTQQVACHARGAQTHGEHWPFAPRSLTITPLRLGQSRHWPAPATSRPSASRRHGAASPRLESAPADGAGTEPSTRVPPQRLIAAHSPCISTT